jgi:hypothetical protein
MRYLILLLVFGITGFTAQAQDAFAQSNLQNLASGSSMFRSFDNRYKGVLGFPTLLEQYAPGRITFVSGKVVDHPQVNYDVVSDELLVMRNGAEMVIDKQSVVSFILNSIEFKKVRLLSGETFAQTLISGKSQLFRKPEKVVKEPTNTGAYSSGNKYSELEAVDKYFWQAPDGSVFEIKSKKTLLSDIKNSSGVDLQQYVKDNKLNIKNPSHLEFIIKYLNGLLQ